MELQKQELLRQLKINKRGNKELNQKRKRAEVKLKNKIKREEKKQKYLEIVELKIKNWPSQGHRQNPIRFECNKQKNTDR